MAVDRKGKPMREPQMSKIATGRSDRFLMEFLVRIAAALTKYDRARNLNAPAVELWEFFVSDEQAALLRERASKSRTETAHDLMMKEFGEFLQHKAQKDDVAVTPPMPTIVKGQAKSKSKR